jgi:hypothetical protein
VVDLPHRPIPVKHHAAHLTQATYQPIRQPDRETAFLARRQNLNANINTLVQGLEPPQRLDPKPDSRR